jgi:hypothetical protein
MLLGIARYRTQFSIYEIQGFACVNVTTIREMRYEP